MRKRIVEEVIIQDRVVLKHAFMIIQSEPNA